MICLWIINTTMDEYTTLTRHLEPQIAQLNRLAKAYLSSEVTLINQVSNYIVNSGGKRLRPLLTLYFNEIFCDDVTEIAEKTEDENSNFINFRKWLRLCYQPKDYDELLRFNQEISKLGREKQKSFLNYGLEIIHNSILINHNQSENIKKTGDELNFTKNFSKFINEANQRDMYNLFNEAIFHIERNAHSGIMYSDMSFKITDLIISGRKYVAKN